MAKTVSIDLSKFEYREEDKLSEVQVRYSGTDLVVTGLPDDHVLDFVARSLSTFSFFPKLSCFYLVHVPEGSCRVSTEIIDTNPKWFRLYIGLENALVEAKVERVHRLKDGQATFIDYNLNGQRGKLYFPSPKMYDHLPEDMFASKTTKLERLV